MKIAYIVTKDIPFSGGIEKYTEEVGSRLAKNGHQVIAYTMKHYGRVNRIYKGIDIRPVPCIKLKILEKMSASLVAALQQITEKNVDIVHFHAFGPAMFAFIPRSMRRKVVVQGHGLEWKRSRWGWPVKALLRLTEIPSVRFADKLTVVSRVQQGYLRQRYGVESTYIPTGINTPSVQQPELIKKYGLNGGDYIFFAGRLVREKGIHYLIEAYNRIKPGLKLVVAGDAGYEVRYKSLLQRLVDGNKNIIFTGSLSGQILEELFSNAYLFVLPSELEGLPTSLLEAMSYGSCCLVSDIPENLEALNNFGYSFRNKDVADLVQKLNYLLNNKDAVSTPKEKAKSHVLESYSWDKIAQQFEDLYSSLLNQ